MFIELQVQYMKTTSSEHDVYMNRSECQNKKQFVYTTGSQLVVFMYWTTEKDLPVMKVKSTTATGFFPSRFCDSLR